MAKLFNNVVIIGTGLIGASVGLNLVSKRMARHVTGVGRGKSNLNAARRRKAIHSSRQIKSTADLFRGEGARLLTEADLILLATPVRTTLAFLERIPDELLLSLKRGCIISDVASTKASIVKLAKRRIKGPSVFVGGHPIAGTEQSGAGAAERNLFKNRTVILTPQGTGGVQKVKRLWKACGARTLSMTPQAHDRLLARVSHLPHMLAYTLVNAVGDPRELSSLAAGGFRDITRIASSDSQMWTDICLENKQALVEAMGTFEKDWRRLKQAVKQGNASRLKSLFARAQKRF